MARSAPTTPLRQRLLQQARRQLRTQGAAGLSLRAVTAAAGVTPMAAYRHFADREALLAALAAEHLRAFADVLREAARTKELRARLFEVCRAYVRFAQGNPAAFELMFGSDIADRRKHPDLYAAGGEAFAVILAMVGECQADGVLDPRLDRNDCAATLWAQVHGLWTLSRHWPTSDRVRMPRPAEELVDAHVERLLEGLRGTSP